MSRKFLDGGHQAAVRAAGRSPAPARLALLVVALFAAAGCSTAPINNTLSTANERIAPFADGRLQQQRTTADAPARAAVVQEALAGPISQAGAVRLALVHSPSLQTLLADSGAELADIEQAARLPNPVFSFERMRLGGELEIGRLLSVGLLDVLLLPQRRALARQQNELVGLRLAGVVVSEVTAVRQAWVRAVAAQQAVHYAEQIHTAAEASAEMAQRMEQVGNFSRLQRARQQVFEADARTRLAAARSDALTERETLVRLLGLDDGQAAALVLPDRLPDLPMQPRSAEAVADASRTERIDLQLARGRLESTARARGVELPAAWFDIELGARRDSVYGAPGNLGERERATRRGVEIDLRLPLFDAGDAVRERLDQQTLAAAHRYDAAVRHATSQLRAQHAAYRTAYDIARHYRDEVVPLTETIGQENLLRYNGMLIGVFDLLEGTREQIAAVAGAIDAQQRFWLADAALSAAVIGQPMDAVAARSDASSVGRGRPTTAASH